MKLVNAVIRKCLGVQEKWMKKKRAAKIAAFTTTAFSDVKQEFSTPMVMEIVPTHSNTKIHGANWLANFKNNDHSEHGEDGIIAKIFELLPPENKWVCEFGAHDPEIISNTWHLIHKQGWNALLIEADSGYFEKLKNYYQNNPAVHCVQTMVSYEGKELLDNVLKDTPVPTNLDFMVIDIDGNDYHVWNAIQTYKAKVVMIEFNASIPTDVSFVQPRNLSVNQGASLKAMVELGKQKGYQLIAATTWNAFFVKEEYYHLFFAQEPALEDMYVFPVKHPIWMRPFQLYDGTIMVAPWEEMLWHKIDLKPSDYQVLPSSYHVFIRELAAQDFVIEKNGDKTPLDAEIAEQVKKIAAMPGNGISQFAKNAYSRYGEDGILEKLVTLVSAEHLFVVDVGAWDGITHSRSRNLIANHRWNALLIDNVKTNISLLKDVNTAYPKVNIQHGYDTQGNNSLNAIFANHSVPENFEVLVLNVYGMEYQLWESLTTHKPKIVAVQFNPTIPNDIKFIQANDFSVHQGASLRALRELAQYKGYELVGVTLETAFFVKRKYFYRLFETIGAQYHDLDAIFSPIQMQLFQLYDGTIVLNGLNRLLWHGLRIDEEKLQVVPKSLRKFHQFADEKYKKFFYRV